MTSVEATGSTVHECCIQLGADLSSTLCSLWTLLWAESGTLAPRLQAWHSRLFLPPEGLGVGWRPRPSSFPWLQRL